MSILRFVILLLFLTMGCLNCGNERLDFNIEETIDHWVAMWNAYDLSLVDELFLTDSRITYISSEKEGIIKGIDAIREHHKGFGFVHGGKNQDNKLWVEDVHTNVFRSTAIVVGTWLFQRGSESSDEVQRGPFTFVYIRKGNAYRLAHLHFANYE